MVLITQLMRLKKYGYDDLDLGYKTWNVHGVGVA